MNESSQQPAQASGDPRTAVAANIVNQFTAAGVGLVASLPDNWIAQVIDVCEGTADLKHVPVNREESAVGLCSGAFFGGTRSLALMGASGVMTIVYAVTKISYTYEVPLPIVATLRGAPGDKHKHHVSNGLYLLPVLDAIDMTYVIVDRAEKMGEIATAIEHSYLISRPVCILLTRGLLRGEA